MTVLVIAAHPDDEVLGCGGTMARHAAQGDKVFSLFCADGETSRVMAAKPNRNFEALAASKILGSEPPIFLDYNDQRLDLVSLLELTRKIEAVVEKIKPSVVYTHHAGDLNMDHQIVNRAALTALRPLPKRLCRQVYAFEVPSSTEWGTPFVADHFVGISGFFVKKLEALNCYHLEMREPPHPRSYSMVEMLGRLRGASVGLNMAEAFKTIRTIR